MHRTAIFADFYMSARNFAIENAQPYIEIALRSSFVPEEFFEDVDHPSLGKFDLRLVESAEA